jgi:curved DNA-binding protein CbpA
MRRPTRSSAPISALRRLRGRLAATYSLFGAEEAEQLRDRIDQAYRVLSDPALRRSYDAARLGEVPEEEEYSDEPVTLAPLDDGLAQPLAEPRSHEVPTFDRMDDGSDAESDDETVWDGARLRRRMRRSVEVRDGRPPPRSVRRICAF